MKSLFEQQGDFFRVMGSPTLETHSLDFCCNLAEKLIHEEVNTEALPALRRYQVAPSRENLVELADGIIDSVYVLLHAANSLGIPFDIVWNEVHRSNMAKVNPDGSVTRREDGKIMKPEGWTKPDIHEVLQQYFTEKEMGKTFMTKGMVS